VTRQLSLEKEEELHSKLEHQLDEVVSSKKRHVYYMILRLASYPGLGCFKGDQQRPWRPGQTTADPGRPGETPGDQGRPPETKGDQQRP